MVSYSTRPTAETKAFNPAASTRAALPVVEASAGPEKAFKSLAADLAALGNESSQWADSAAQQEGQRAGAVAGTADGYAPRRDNTLYGASYDAAGNRAFLNKMETQARGELMDAALNHGDDPAALKGASDKIRATYTGLATRQVPELAGDLDATLRRTGDSYIFQAGKEHRDKREREDREGFAVATGQRAADIARIAVGGASDPNVGTRVDAEIKRLEADIDNRPDLSPAQRERLKSTVRTATTGALLEGQVEAAPDIATVQRIRAAYTDAWVNKKGAVGRLSQDGYEAGIKALDQREAALTRAGVAAQRQVSATAEEIEQRVLAGEQIDATRLATMRTRIVTGDPSGEQAARVDDLMVLQRWGQSFRSVPLGDQRATVAALDEKAVRHGLTVAEEKQRVLARAVLKQREQDETSDRLGTAMKNYGFQLGNLDWTAPNIGDQARSRIIQAEQFARETNGPVTYLTRQNIDTFKRVIDADPAAAPAIGQRILREFGDRAPQVLKEIAPTLPSLAFVLRPGNAALAADWSKAAKAEQEGVKLPVPATSDLIAIMKDRSWTDLFTGRENEMAKMASAAAPVIAARLGVTVAKFDAGDSDHKKVARETLLDMLGRTKDIDGRDRGGPTEINRMQTMAPSTLRPDNFRSVIGLLTDDDLQATGLRPFAGGKELRRSDVAGAKWIPVAKDRYRLAAGDPRNGQAQFIQNKAGDPLEIDLSPSSPLINRMRARAPSLFR